MRIIFLRGIFPEKVKTTQDVAELAREVVGAPVQPSREFYNKELSELWSTVGQKTASLLALFALFIGPPDK
jgi:hypothetical protein